MIKFLDLQRVTALHGNELQEAAKQVIESGWYLQGKPQSVSNSIMRNISERIAAWEWPTDWMH